MNRADQLLQYAHAQRKQLFPNLLKDFQELVRRAPNEAVVQGIAAAFYAGSPESFADSVRNLFVHSDDALRAELLNTLVRSVSRETQDALSNAGLFGLD